MSTAIVDLTKMSAAEIKAFIENQGILPAAPTDPPRPRDENGRFVAAEPDPQADPNADPQADPEPIVVEKEIDLADGSGVQVFRGVGATKEEAYAALADELATAQANATKKIRELASRPATPAPTPVADTPESEFLLQQRLLDAPRATIRELLKEEFGLTPAEIKTKLAAADNLAKAQEQDRIANQFIAANPDYNPDPKNAKRLIRQMHIEGLPETVESLQKVYNDLKADGLITQKADDTPAAPRPRASGLSTRSSVPPPPAHAVDVSKLTVEQLRELAGGYQNPYSR